MKLFLFTFIATLLIAEITSADSEEITEEVEKWVHDCEKELEIPKEKMDEYQTMSEPPNDHMGNCLTHCVFEKAGVIANEKIDKTKIQEFVGALEHEKGMEEIRGIADECQTEANKKTDKCDMAGAFSQCVYEKIKSAEDSKDGR